MKSPYFLGLPAVPAPKDILVGSSGAKSPVATMSRAAPRMATLESGPSGPGALRTWHEKRALLLDGPPSYVNAGL